MAKRYGIQELMRRVKNGSILVRKDKVAGEFEFMLVKEKKYEEETDNINVVQKNGGSKEEQELFHKMLTRSDSYSRLSDSKGSNMDPDLNQFFQAQGAKGSLLAVEESSAAKTDANSADAKDDDVVLAEELSQAGSTGRVGKMKITKFIEIFNGLRAQTSDADAIGIIKKHIGNLKKFNVPGSRFKLEDVKDTLCKAAKAVKTIKDMMND